MKNVFRKASWCTVCKKEVSSSVCTDCGASFMKGDLWVFAIVEEKFFQCKRRLFSPSTWFGGHWKIINVQEDAK